MIIDGTISSDKTDILIKEYVKLLNSGVPSSKILVLVQNSNLKENFLNQTFQQLKIESLNKIHVYSFFGLVYNTINDNWAYLENINSYGKPYILPNLTGLEVSQYILNEIIKDVKFKGYNSKKSLLHQLFRRYSLIVQNNLSEEEVDKRSKILKESFAPDAKIALNNFLKKTLELREFDYLRQTLLFKYIYINTDYFSDIEYLILDDGDEITPVCYDFITHLNLKQVFIAFDKFGGSRTGYLSADKNVVWKFENLFKEKAIKLESNSKLKDDAQVLFDNIINDNVNKMKYFTVESSSKRAKMIELVAENIKKLQKQNIKPCEISVITPVIDDMLKFSLKENLKVNFKIISGNEKLAQNKIVQAVLTILKLNTELRHKITEMEIRLILYKVLGINVRYCREILEKFAATKTLIQYDFKDEDFNLKYSKLLNLINKLSISNIKLSEQVCEIYDELFEFKEFSVDEINKFNFFIKQLRDFENVFGDDFNNKKTDIILQIENSVIAENPYSILDIKNNDLIVSTPQKVIDNQIRTKYQIWLDVSSDEWVKNDTGPLYNAWVFQKGWDKDSFTVDDNINLGKDKNARILRKLVLCADEKIFAYSSLFDSNGVENFGGIEKYLKFEEKGKTPNKSLTIQPRKDQLPVLDYKSGKMAISAVPGAGKTTILLLLILKLLDMDILPENIFVLTYMESAARNFRDRIKTLRPNTTELPNISTIHGLALRILKENGNYERLGLNPDFEICDDTQRSQIFQKIFAQLNIKSKNDMEDFIRAISIYKHLQGNLSKNGNVKLNKFIDFFNLYQAELENENMIDYDDMLIFSVKLLEENKDILEYYQEICKYVIEDEAQDSSAIQQRLIELLSGKYKNLIRCGDINQAITTTFSNADVEGFRKFILNSNSVNMDCSQRCTKDVYTLANNLVKFTQNQSELKNSFFEIFMNPVAGKNPVSDNAVTAKVFQKPNDEKNYILKVIKQHLAENPKSTIGILVRYNTQVAKWSSIINDSGFKTITRSECLGQKLIFKVIFAILKMVAKPFDNNVIADNYDVLAEAGFYKGRFSNSIRKLEIPFAEVDFDKIEDIYLAQFYCDLTYWLSMPHISPDELALKIGLTYFSGEIEKSNVYLIATLIKRLNSNDLTYIVERLDELSQKPKLSGFNFFMEEDENDKKFFEGKVQIMTLHKSKGDEFDLVFLPEFTEDKLPLTIGKVKLKSFDFEEGIKSCGTNHKIKSEFEYKKDILSENLRLLYVAITRAKSQLYITTSKISAFNSKYTQTPSRIFKDLLEVANE